MSRQHLSNIRSSVVVNGEPKLPSASTLQYGEIAVNYGASGETLSIRNSLDKVVTFSNDNKIEEKIEDRVTSLMHGSRLSFYTKDDITVSISDKASGNLKRTESFSANTIASTNVQLDESFVINNTNNSVLYVYSWPSVCEQWYDWFDDVLAWENTIFHFSDGTNTYIDASHWHGTNAQGKFGVTEAQYKNCIFWDDNPMTNNLNSGPYFYLHKTIECPLFYSTISANTYSNVREPYNILLNPNWNNPIFINSFESGPGGARGYQVFSYCNQRSIPSATFTDPDVGTNIITLPAAINGLCAYGGMETIGTFDATNVTNWLTGSTNWNSPFISCYKLRELRIKNLKASLNISWSPISYESLKYIVDNAANENAITIYVSSRSYYDIDETLFNAASAKNITFTVISANYKDDAIWEDVATLKSQTIPTKTSDLTNDSAFVTSADTANFISGYTETDPTVPAWAKAESKPTYTASEVGALATGTTLDSIADGSTRKLSVFFDDAEYDSNTKRINFKNNGTVKDYIDATDFIKDGMVSSVTITGGNLVISFNTDAGREDISLGLTQIFNPNNYYDKDSADAKFLSAYTETDPVFTGSPAYGITAQDITNWNGKQAAINDLNDIRNNAAYGASAYTAVTAHIANTGLHLPAVTSDNNGKILQVVNGAWALVTPVTIYTGNGEPSSVLGNNGDIYLQTS